jgi:hypothetical protein
MKHFTFWQRWLFIVGVLIVASGLLLAFIANTFLFDLLGQMINPVFWGSSAIAPGAIEFQKFIYGVLGATMSGWGVFLLFIAHYPFKNKEKWSWYCVLIGLVAWFALDTSISLFYKVYGNVLVNAVFLVATLLPLVFTREMISKN